MVRERPTNIDILLHSHFAGSFSLLLLGVDRISDAHYVRVMRFRKSGRLMVIQESIRQWVLTNLPYDQTNAALDAYLKGLDASRLLIVYYNWDKRFIRPRRRAVNQSNALRRNPLATQLASELAHIIDDIEDGRDLTRYLSEDIVRAVVDVPGRNVSRRDLDLMLNDWAVHHLHLSTTMQPNGFVVRSDPLLFVAFRPEAAYLIDIMKHGDWTRDHVLEVMIDEWPAAGVVHEVKGALPNPQSSRITEQQRRALTKAHIDATFEYNGKLYMPADGLTSAGTSESVTFTVNSVMRTIRGFENTMAANPDSLKAQFAQAGVTYPNQPIFEFGFRDDRPGLMETSTGTWLWLFQPLSSRSDLPDRPLET